MKKALSLLLALLILCPSFAGCGKTVVDTPDSLNTVEIKKISTGMNRDSFDEKLLSYLSEHSDGNYMVSPLSFRYALGLLLAGAKGETKTQLLNALGVKSIDEWTNSCTTFNGFAEQFKDALAADIAEYQNGVKQGYVEKNSAEPFRALRVANSVWKREDIKADYTESYRDYISKNYAAEYKAFTPSNAVKKINEWASAKTEKMIEKLLPDDYDTKDLAFVLMNALYFKDSWVHSFSKELTEDGDFTTRSGEKVTKTFMRQTEDFYYYADSDTQLVILPMEGNLYMTFVLGDTDNLAEKVSKAARHSVTVTIPKIDLETSFSNGELVQFLAENGVSDAFDSEKADFSAMIDHPIWVDDIIQKTKIKLDEDGVEAAAVTAIMMKDTAFEPEQPFVFTADRPFSFYLYTTCNDTTALLFAGEIVE